MKTNKEPTFVHTDGVGEVKRATIKASAKIFNFFADQIYSDKFTAIWRELVANAIDAQKMNGVTTPPVVTVPSILEPYAKVRDFGCSMDHEFMMNKFMAFTDASTKENSDEYIGGFGIGSKAPLSYTEQYSIRCFLNGEVRVYSVFKDDEGCPSIAFLSKAPTDEPDGVEVGFPVRQDDIQSFIDTVVETLQYFEPQPVLENTDLKLEPIKYDVRGKKWGIRVMGNRSPRIIIGGVAYPLETSKIPYTHTTLRNFATMGLDIYLDIGEANIALSREQVTHDADLFDRLANIVGNIGDEFGKQMSKMFDACTTEWEAKMKLAEVLKTADYAMGNLLRKHAYWKGKQLTTHVKRPENTELLIIAYGSFTYQDTMSHIVGTQAVSPKFRRWESHAYFAANTFARIVIADTTDKPMLRLRALIEKNPTERIFVIKDNSEKGDTDMAEVLKAMGNPPASMIDYLSKWDPIKVVRGPSTGTYSRPFKCYVRDTSPYRGSTPQDQLPAGGGLYIVMENFAPKMGSVDITRARMMEHKNIVWLNLTDFKASGIENMKEWYSVEQAVQKVKSTYRSKHKRLAEAEAWYQHNSKHNSLLYNLDELAKNPAFPKRGPLAQLWALHQRHKDTNDRGHSSIRKDLLNVDYEKPFKDIAKIISAAQKKHPCIAEVCADHYLIRKLSQNTLSRLF